MKSCRPDALEGLKKRKDDECIVLVEDDALKQLLGLTGKSMFKGLTTCDMSLPCLTCERLGICCRCRVLWAIPILQ
ncbi:hypothetical protein [Acetomicrobium sp.]|uniref:hypothetical protein n=1 Tax=Acetomicrobium sp. TaxID=1872099 RepID=UPI002B256B6D|nr:hypothetical protein [Acetomicrobium sp.]